MSANISGTTITLTRGDTLKAHLSITKKDGTTYSVQSGDTIRFAVKENYEDGYPLVYINIPTNTLDLEIRPSDTKHLDFGDYVYDVELTTSNGEVYTFISKAKFIVTEEVY